MSSDSNRPPRRVGGTFDPYKLYRGSFLPEPIARYRNLSPGAKNVYARLMRYVGSNSRCWPAVRSIAREVGLGVRQTSEYLQELRKKGFISIEKRHGRPSVYRFLWHPAFEGDIGEPRNKPPRAKRISSADISMRGTAERTEQGTATSAMLYSAGLVEREAADKESQLKENQKEERQRQIDQAIERRVNLSLASAAQSTDPGEPTYKPVEVTRRERYISETPVDAEVSASDKIACLGEALLRYVMTDKNGNDLAYPPEWAVVPPDVAFVREVGEICDWDFDWIYPELVSLKRNGKKPTRSYGWFKTVLLKRRQGGPRKAQFGPVPK